MDKNKELFKNSEVFDGFRYLRWDIALRYAEDCKKEARNQAIEDVERVVNDIQYQYEKSENEDAILCLTEFKLRLKEMKR